MQAFVWSLPTASRADTLGGILTRMKGRLSAAGRRGREMALCQRYGRRRRRLLEPAERALKRIRPSRVSDLRFRPCDLHVIDGSVGLAGRGGEALGLSR